VDIVIIEKRLRHRLIATTNDPLYHFWAFFQFGLSIEEG
jgi:hypothetical protein